MLPLKKSERTASVQLLQVYAKYKKQFLNPGINKQEVWEKIAREMKEKGFFNYDELPWHNKLLELRQHYERIKCIPATNGEMVDFKIAAKNAFQNTENLVPVNYPVPETSSTLPLKKYERKMENVVLLQVYAKYKKVFLTPGVNKQVVWKKIACEMKEKGFFNYDESYWCSKVEELRQEYERIKYVPATNGEMVDFKIAAKNAFQTDENPVTAVPKKVKMTEQKQRQLNSVGPFKKNIMLLTVYTLHKHEFSFHKNSIHVWKKIADKMNEKFPESKSKPGQCRTRIFFMKKHYVKVKDRNSKVLTRKKDDIFLKEAKLAFETKEHSVTFVMDEKRQKQIASLWVFNKYKAQFLSPDANPEELWQKITETANKLLFKRKPFNALNFREYIASLKSNYDNLKDSTTDVPFPDDAIFLEEAKIAFENTGSEVISVDQILHIGCSKEKFERNLSLLRAYNIYKAEFSSPKEDDESVWEKIADTVRISCSLDKLDLHDCRLQLSQMKENYKKKKRDGYLIPEANNLFEEEKLAFETAGYSEDHGKMDLL